MLAVLRIRRLAVIDEATFEFGPGLNIISGETGAGKTIVMNALGLISGARASAEMVRSDQKEAVVEGLFELEGAAVSADLAEALNLSEGAQVLIRRSVAEGGRSRATINGELTTLQSLSALGSNLVQVFGQHEQQQLLRTQSHLAILDQFGDFSGDLEEYRRIYHHALELQARVEELKRRESERERRLDLARFQLAELGGVGLVAGEDEELSRQRRILANAARLALAAHEAETVLYGGESAAIDAVGSARSRLAEAATLDPTMSEPLKLLDSASAALEEAARWLRGYAERVEADPARLEEIEQRLEQLNRIKRKYGGSIEGALDALEHARKEIEQLETTEQEQVEVARELTATLARLTQVSRALSEKRRAAAAQLKQKAEAELRTLGIRNPIFEPRFATLAPHASALSFEGMVLGPNGGDDLEFYIAFNLGQPPLALTKVASGGELSRVMLALKCLEARRRSIATLVFDEVDAGIGGAIAQVVGLKLKTLARHHQILCVTHLPQIAAFADKHFVVEKREERGTTASSVTELGPAERVEELARMIGGSQRNDRITRAARELLERARLSAGEAA
jgi:DNA repair protein RecN (Recombination protein N)